VGEIVAEHALSRFEFMRDEKERDGGYAHNQREYDFQSLARQDAPVLRGRYFGRGRIKIYLTIVC
jgi:hypothetical protein